ncbi:LytTR family DNA-binding domain-containing protein [Flammeovirgaceae bacterium SG7u.111]|nr:LytTR family DNA-binding domain-containing protein [Flammeovirgaceae bacterium SG7u.132]WPO37356.1 LytTR family DNA-binding domain-containing protein [Flammeovirgaceae bacterium SG7u.111]
MEKLKCLLVDDEKLALTLLESYISKLSNLEVVGKFQDPLKALALLQDTEVDLMFLDIQMPNLTGIELLQTLPSNKKPLVVFSTAYAEFALDGYQLDVVDYLLKPFPFERFLKAVNKASQLIELKRKAGSTEGGNTRQGKNFMLVRADHRIYKLQFDELLYVEGLKEYVSYFTKNERIIALESLKKLETILPTDQFMRIHKSYIASVRHIKAIEGSQVVIGDKLLPIGKTYKEAVMKKVFAGES